MVADHDAEHHGKHHLPIPLISVSMNTDVRNYTIRMIKSIDYPVNHLVIQVGNSDKSIVDKIVRGLKEHELVNGNVKRMSINTLPYNPGSAKGFNYGLHRIHPGNNSWVLVINNDISFFPGILKRIARNVEHSFLHDPKFGVGFTSLCCGGEWSAVAFTGRLVDEIGYFDENFYPAYYEDDDYAIRIHYSSYHAVRFNNTPLLHGEIDGSKDYLSGLFTQLYLRPEKNAATDEWRRAHEAGMKVSVPYIEAKWGAKMGDFKSKTKLDCKSLEGINSKCITPYKRPFNDEKHNLSYWEMSAEVLQRINSQIKTG